MDRALRLPRVKPLLHLPVSAIVEIVSNRSEADVLLRIGDLAHEFDELTAYLVQWLEHQKYLKVSCVLAEEPRAWHTSSLAPLTCQARAANGRGVALLQQRITECLQKLQRHADSVRVFADQNASFSQELRLCGLEARADQRRQLAETESALAYRLSKFLGGCDSFYDEQPLPLAVRFAAEAAAAAATAAATAAAAEAGKAPPARTPRPNASSSEARMSRPGSEENPGAGAECSADDPGGSRKRSCPGGLPGSHALRVCYRTKEGEGAGNVAADRRGGRAAARRGDCASSLAVNRNPPEPSFLEKNGERGQQNGAAVAAGEPTTDEASKQLAEDADNDGFAAPSFLTPPVVTISDGLRPARGNGVMGRASRSTPLSASSSCYSASSTPTNDSSSPALAVASPSAKAPRRPDGPGLAGSAVVPPPPGGGGGGGGRKRARGSSSCSTLVEGGGGVPREENNHHSSSCSSLTPTPPSTAGDALSLPPLSTQEGSSPAPEGDVGDTAAAANSAVGDACGNGALRGKERGLDVEVVRNGGGSVGTASGVRRRQAGRAPSGGAETASESSAAGSGRRGASGVSGFVLRGPTAEVDKRNTAGWQSCARVLSAAAAKKKPVAARPAGGAGDEEEVSRQRAGSSATEDVEESKEEDEDEDESDGDFADTGDTIEDSVVVVPSAAEPAAAAAAESGARTSAGEDPETNRNRRRRSREEGRAVEDNRARAARRVGAGRNRARGYGRRQAKVEPSQESEESEGAFSWSGSQGQGGGGVKLEASDAGETVAGRRLR